MTDRRVRFKVDTEGVAEAVTAMLTQGATYDEIAAALEAQHGVGIGKSSIARYNNDLQRRLSRVARVRDAAQAMSKEIAKRVGDDPDSQLSEMLIDIMQCTLLEKFGDELKPRDVSFLASAGAQVVKAKTSLDAARATERKRMKAAWERVTAELKTLLEKSNLWPEVETVLSEGMSSLESDSQKPA